METKLNSLNIIDDLVINPQFNKSKIKKLLDELSQEAYAGPLSKYLFAAARFVREKSYGHNVFLRGLIEFTNYCKNDCYYCGIRCSNHKATRYRLSLEEILLSEKDIKLPTPFIIIIISYLLDFMYYYNNIRKRIILLYKKILFYSNIRAV